MMVLPLHKSLAVIALLATGIAVADNPAIVMREDFTGGTFLTQWDVGSHLRRFPREEFVRCEPGFGFDDECAAWSNRLLFDRSWGFWGHDARRVFVPQSEFYVRWYQYISSPYEWGTLEDKSVLLHDPAETVTALVGTSRDHLPSEANSGPGMPYVANYQDLDGDETGGRFNRVNRFQNQQRNLVLQPGRWYLFEWYIRLNSPGRSDGATRLWVDDASQPITEQTLRLHYEDLRWLRNRDAGRQFGMLRLTLYHQRCDLGTNTCPPIGPEVLDQSHRWDAIVISTNPIGPIDREH